MSNHQQNEANDPDLRTRLEARRGGAHWWRRAALTMLAAAVSVPFAADALGPVPHSFSSGGVISATEMNANFAHLQNGITANENQVPVGTVAFFDLSTCPAGWSEVAEARGRTLVGLAGSAGTLRGTVGDSLTDMENPSHSHDVDVPAFDSGSSSVAHTHSIPSATTGSGGAHNHQWWNEGSSYASNGTTPVTIPGFPVPAGSVVLSNFHTADLYTSDESSHTHSIATRTSGAATSTSHDHSVDPPSRTSTAVSTSDLMPYVQFLVCRRG